VRACAAADAAAAAEREAALAAEAEEARAALEDARALYGRRSAVARAAKQQRAPPAELVGHTSSNRYLVPPHATFDFLAAIVARGAALEGAPGFLAIQVAAEPQREGAFRVSTLWESPAACSAWAASGTARRSHDLPDAVRQFAPARGEGVPEDHMPFVQE
jgi:heme-degrading monooxygenase HmoA